MATGVASSSYMTKEEGNLLSVEDIDKYIEYCRENPVFAAKDILKISLAPHQRIALKNMWDAKWVLNIWGRGLGKTFMNALYALLRAMLYSGEKIVIVAPSFRQSIFVFLEMEKIVNQYCPELKINFTRWPPRHHTLEYRAELFNNSTITALPLGTDGSKIRGTRATCIIVDEAREVDKEVVETAVIPFMVVKKDPMAGYDGRTLSNEKNVLIFTTSAYYQFNHVYDRYILYLQEVKKNNPDYCVTVFDFNDAPRDFCEMDVIEMQRQTMSELEFAMEYLAKMPRDSLGFFPASMVHAGRTRLAEPKIRGVPGKRYIIGVDPGDTTGIVVLEEDGGELTIVQAEEIALPMPRLRQHVDDLLDLFPSTTRVAIEAFGGGKTLKDLFATERIYINKATGQIVKKQPLLVIDDKETEHIKGERIIELIVPSLPAINEMNFDLRAKFENRLIMIPASPGSSTSEDKDFREIMYKNIMDLLRQITDISISETQLGYYKFESPEGRTRHMYSALLCAAWAADHVAMEPTRLELPTGGWTTTGLHRR